MFEYLSVVEVESNIVGETSDLIIKDDHKKSGIGYKKLVRSIELGKVKYILVATSFYLITTNTFYSIIYSNYNIIPPPHTHKNNSP